MALVKVTSIHEINIVEAGIQQEPGRYQAYHMHDYQADNIAHLLELARAANLLTYEIESDTGSKRHAKFTYKDVKFSCPILLGVIPAKVSIDTVSLNIITPFNNNTRITIGSTSNSTFLLGPGDNDPLSAYQYKNDADYRFAKDTLIYVYFPTGTPTVGEAEVFVYLS
jgi:hypothetical protein